MFTKEQTKVMKPVLGRKYAADVLAVLSSKKIVSYKNMPYRENTIRAVFGCKQGNYEIENAILKVYTDRLQAVKQMEWEKEQLLNANTL